MHDYRKIAAVLRESPTLGAAAATLGMSRAALSQVCYRMRKRYPASFPCRRGGRPVAVFVEVTRAD